MNTEIDTTTQIKKIEESIKNYKYVFNSKNTKFTWLGNWLRKESSFFKNEVDKKLNKNPNFKRGDVIKADFGVNVGSELSNIHFAIVLNSDDNTSIDNITVLPLTSKPGYKRLYFGNLLNMFKNNNKNTYALITQITTISKKKIIKSNIKFRCNAKIMEIINKEIIRFFTK